jgi:hypothetical protein
MEDDTHVEILIDDTRMTATLRAERTCGGTVDDTLLAVTQFTKDVLRARLQVTVVSNSNDIMAQLTGHAVEDAARSEGRAVSPTKLTRVCLGGASG